MSFPRDISAPWAHAIRGRDFTWDDGPEKPQCRHDRQGLRQIPGRIRQLAQRRRSRPDARHRRKWVRASSASWTTCMKKPPKAIPAGRSTTRRSRPAPSSAELVVRTTLPPATLAASVLGTLRDINPKQTAAEFKPIQIARKPRQLVPPVLHVAGRRLRRPRHSARRPRHLRRHLLLRHPAHPGDRHPHGPRLAPIQRPADILLKTLRLAVIGILTGAVASLFVSRAIAALLFNTAPRDPITFTAMASSSPS